MVDEASVDVTDVSESDAAVEVADGASTLPSTDPRGLAFALLLLLLLPLLLLDPVVVPFVPDVESPESDVRPGTDN